MHNEALSGPADTSEQVFHDGQQATESTDDFLKGYIPVRVDPEFDCSPPAPFDCSPDRLLPRLRGGRLIGQIYFDWQARYERRDAFHFSGTEETVEDYPGSPDLPAAADESSARHEASSDALVGEASKYGRPVGWSYNDGVENPHGALGETGFTWCDTTPEAVRDMELSAKEVSLLYEMDAPLPRGANEEQERLIRQIRDARGDRDQEAISRILHETVDRQRNSAYQAYEAVARDLGTEAISESDLQEILEAKHAEWQAAGLYEYMAEQAKTSPVSYTLVAVPNVEVNAQQIISLANAFSDGQPMSTQITTRPYIHDTYSPAEWAGKTGDEKVRVFLVPSDFEQKCSQYGWRTPAYAGIMEQKQLLEERREQNPDLNFSAMSMLDALAHCYARRARGDSLTTGSPSRRAGAICFGMEPRVGEVESEKWVPDLKFEKSGRLHLSYSSVGLDSLNIRMRLG